MSFRNLALTLLVASTIAIVGCNKTHPVMNFEGTPIVTASGQKDLKAIKKAIIYAGTRIGWQMQPAGPGHIVGTLFNRGHMAKVDIKYNTDTYNVTYKDSSNLLYDGALIHRNYNRWVDRLNRNIRAELNRL